MGAFFIGLITGVFVASICFYCMEATEKQILWLTYYNFKVFVFEKKTLAYTLYYAETYSQDGTYRKETGYYFSSDDATEAAFENATAYEKSRFSEYTKMVSNE